MNWSIFLYILMFMILETKSFYSLRYRITPHCVLWQSVKHSTARNQYGIPVHDFRKFSGFFQEDFFMKLHRVHSLDSSQIRQLQTMVNKCTDSDGTRLSFPFDEADLFLYFEHDGSIVSAIAFIPKSQGKPGVQLPDAASGCRKISGTYAKDLFKRPPL